jgi:hypothetical protein
MRNLRMALILLAIGAPTIAFADPTVMSEHPTLDRNVPCFVKDSAAYCLFPDGNVIIQACEDWREGSEYCALKEGRGKIVSSLVAPSAQLDLPALRHHRRR